MNDALNTKSSDAVIITGAARGIGRSIADRFAKAGLHVAAVDRDSEGLEKLQEEYAALSGYECSIHALDTTDPGAPGAVLKYLRDRELRTAILVNNAGISAVETPEELSLETWDKVLGVNLTAMFYWSQQVGIEMMSQGRGSIVSIASMSASIVNRPRSSVVYNAAKAGVVAVTRTLAVEWADRGVRVNCVSPGYVDTELTRASLDPLWLEMTPMGRMGATEEIAEAVYFLASERSSFTTGSELIVDGGYTSI